MYRGQENQMPNSIRIAFDGTLYDEDAVEETVAEFRNVADVQIRQTKVGLEVTVKAAADVVEKVAGALMNISLARTIEVRS
jgi:hypothetical protein